MRKRKLLVLFSITVLLLSGCNKTEKDSSFDTDLYGTYESNIEASNIDYIKNDTYTLNKKDNSYKHVVYEKYNDNILRDSTTNDKINNIENINDNIMKIELNNGDSFEITLNKYKNMLGKFYQTEIPKDKTFDLFVKNEDSETNDGIIFDKDGFYHYCTNHDNCSDDSSTFIKYKHKGNYIYQADSKGNWTILMYIVEDGVFIKEYAKAE